MNINDELDAMLETLKNGGRPVREENMNQTNRGNSDAPAEDEYIDNSGESLTASPEKEDEISDDFSEDSEQSAEGGDSGKDGRKSVADALKNIFDENPDSLADERTEKNEPDVDEKKPPRDKEKLKKRFYTVMGVIFTVFAVIGFVASVKYVYGTFRSFATGQQKKNDFLDVIYPAVVMDIQEFENPSQLSNDQIITAAIWSLIMSPDEMNKYESTLDVVSVPAIDIEAYAAELFGSEIPELTHETVGSGELKFYYNSESKSYNIPVNPVTFTYKPEISSISKNGNEYTITVDYIKEVPEWMENNSNYSSQISKTAEFKLIDEDGSCKIESMSVISINSAL